MELLLLLAALALGALLVRSLGRHQAHVRQQIAAGMHQLESAAPQGALSTFSAVIRLDPAHAEAQYGLGLALLALGRQDEARLALKEALKLQPDFAPARQQLIELGEAAPEP